MSRLKHSEEAEIAVLTEKITNIDKNVTEIKKKMEDNFVTKQEFEPYKRLVYGMVALILTAVMTALVASVIKK